MFPECTDNGDGTWDYSVIGDHEILVVGARLSLFGCCLHEWQDGMPLFRHRAARM
jgi:hypothetical protein